MPVGVVTRGWRRERVRAPRVLPGGIESDAMDPSSRLVHALAATPHAGLAGTTPRLGVAARLDAPANVFGLQGEEVRKYYPCLPPDCEDSAVSVVLLLKWRSRYECRVGSDDVAAKDVDAQVKNPCVPTRAPTQILFHVR
jgi:hypothetical protein